jgi:hypothetical protein
MQLELKERKKRKKEIKGRQKKDRQTDGRTELQQKERNIFADLAYIRVLRDSFTF